MKTTTRRHSGLLPLAALLCLAMPGFSQIPHLLHHQGRVAVDGVNFNGTGQFKFALVDAGTNVSRQATAIPVISNGYLTGVTVTDGGVGYTSAPSATAKDIKTGGGSGARLQCTVSGGAVTGITVVDPGAGYTGFTTVQISAPPPSIVYQPSWRSRHAPAALLPPVCKSISTAPPSPCSSRRLSPALQSSPSA